MKHRSAAKSVARRKTATLAELMRATADLDAKPKKKRKGRA